MRIRQSVIVLLAAVMVLLLATTGCERSDPQAISSEADEANFRHGQQLVKQGRSQEALAAFLKVIAKRGESAPESHLEAGLLYLDQVKDPLAAIYHFRKYLELLPNARQAVYVRGRIDVAKREFARTLPAQPLESQSGLDLLDKLDRLQRENEQLKAELATLRDGVPGPMIRSRALLGETAAASTSSGAGAVASPSPPFVNPSFATPAESPVSLASETPAPARPSDSGPLIAPAPAAATRAPPTKPTAPAAAARRHVVVKGDTLFSLAQKYYGNRARWRDLYAANRDVLPSENSLRLGMELKIP